MLKENIQLDKLQLNDPLIATFTITLGDVLEECCTLAELLSMIRLFKTIAIHRQDFPAATKFREAEVELKKQAADFEHSWAWMNAAQMQAEIKRQVVELLPTLSFKPDLGVQRKSPAAVDDGPAYDPDPRPQSS